MALLLTLNVAQIHHFYPPFWTVIKYVSRYHTIQEIKTIDKARNMIGRMSVR